MQFSQAFDPIRSCQAAWKLLKQAPLSILLGALLPIAVQVVLGLLLDVLLFLPLGLSQSFERGTPQPWIFVLLFGLGSVFGLFMTGFSCWMDAGFGRAIEHALRTGQDSASLVFSGAGRFVTLLLARLLVGLIAFGCMLVLMLPVLLLMTVFAVLMQTSLPMLLKVAVGTGIGLAWLIGYVYVLLGLSLVTAVVLYEDCGPGQAIARSWRLVRGNRWRLLVFGLFQFVLMLASMLACGIGWLIALPMTEVMRLEAYLALTRGREYRNWWIVTGKFPFEEHKTEDFGSGAAAASSAAAATDLRLRMPHAIEESVEIRATPEQVFDFVQDPAQRSAWDEGVRSAERRGDELAIRYRVFGPLSCEMVFAYTLLDRPKRSAVKLVRSRGACIFASAGGAWFYEPTASGTRFTTKFTYQTRLVPAGLVRGSIEKATRRSLARLKARIEGSQRRSA